MRLSWCVGLVASVVMAAARERPATVTLAPGHTEQLTASVFGVVTQQTDAGVEYGLLLEPAFLDDVHLSAPADAGLTLMRLEKRARVSVSVVDGGVVVRGAEVERIEIPATHQTDRAQHRFVLALPRPDILELTDIYGSGCPVTNVTTFFRLHRGRAERLISVSMIGEAGYWHGTSASWGGKNGDATSLLGFPTLELVDGVPASQQLTVIDEVVEEDRLVCSTRRRFRERGGALQLLDVTHANDGGCPPH